MSILDTDVVDVIGIDAPNGIARLAISDHLAWDQAERDHLVLLQDKINTYLVCLESGTGLRKQSQCARLQIRHRDCFEIRSISASFEIF
ncbi:DUF6572 domain-containing protein [Paraburkholderia tropica]|uniref:DUF6572 domain-containing protein n=1 Tax=Paraburkholderia tropica TaxID=92647 RepID=UPI00296FDCFE|nr:MULTISPECIES: DUF6572 domain-containing protein [Paraburkholderia]